MINDVAWVDSGERFIVIAGNQPAVATLYDKDCNALFEFGKRYRNTIRICPFSQLLLIGGFGNLKGEIDIWSIESLEQVGKTRSDCAIGIEWAPDGQHLMTSVLFERVKVDNQISIFNGCGKKLLAQPHAFGVLNSAQWQPYPAGTFPRPNVAALQQAFAEEEAKKPKRTFMMPQQDSAFSQMMRQQMGGAGSEGPRRLDQNDKKTYKEMGSTQAANAKDKVQAVNEKAKARNTNSTRPTSSAGNDGGFVANWRKGNFGTPAAPLVPSNPIEEPAEVMPTTSNGTRGRGGRREEPKPRPAQTTCYGADLIVYDGEEKKVSKHAKRRANKKAKQAAVGSTENGSGSAETTQASPAALGNHDDFPGLG